MAVGLLVILVMLGTTFLMVSRMDATQAKALAEKAPADPLAEGIVEQIRTILYDDLYIGTSDGPYAQTDSGADGWRQFIDHPSGSWDSSGDPVGDPWLASATYEDTASGTIWRHISNIDGSSVSQYDDVPINDADLVDTDGDGVGDARLYDTGVTNVAGEEYAAAVRIIDLSGLINVNTAATPTPLTTPVCPVNVALSTCLGGFYNAVHDARCGGTGAANDAFYTNSASRLLSPSGAYLPFSIGDETFLRWAKPLLENPPVAVGRLHAEMGSMPDDYRRLLTTFNCSRNLMRRPTEGEPNDTFDRRVKVLLDSDIGRHTVYRRLVKLLRLGNINSPERKAAHILANLMVATTTPDFNLAGVRRLGHIVEFQPYQLDQTDADIIAGTATKETWRVYGVDRAPVISEAFSDFVQDTSPGPGYDNYTWFAAVEICNPYSQTMLLTGAGYELHGVPLTGSLAPGERLVYWNYFRYASPGEAEGLLNIQAGALLLANRINDIGFRFYGHDPDPIRLTRTANSQDGVSRSVVIDQVSKGDVGSEATAPSEASEKRSVQRDEDEDRHRFNVAAYWLNSGGDAHTKHTLGLANTVDFDNPSYPVADDDEGNPASCAFAVPVTVPGTVSMADLWDAGHVYFVGPESDDRCFPKEVRAEEDSPARGRLDLRSDDLGDSDGPDYPDVPYAALAGELLELLEADDERLDEQAEGAEPSRFYGKININTAPRESFWLLPWPGQVTIDGTNYDVRDDFAKTDRVADYILAYRQMLATGLGGPDYSDRASGSQITGLRGNAAADVPGFLTPGELAVPLADYVNNEILSPKWDGDTSNVTNDSVRKKDYLEARDSLYRSVSNLVTVNSDVYAAYILVRLRDEFGDPKQDWRYLAVIDRSNCRRARQLPAILLLSQIR